MRRLVAAWISEDFTPVEDILSNFATRRPLTCWNPVVLDLPDPRFATMNRVWNEHRDGAELPHISRCRIEDFGDAAAVMMVLDFWADQTDLDYRHYGEELAFHAGGSQAGSTVGTLAQHAPYSIFFAASYYAAAVYRKPHYSEVVSAPKLVSTTWCRYLLPYVDDNDRVMGFACGNIPFPGLASWPAVGRAPSSESKEIAQISREMAVAEGALARMERNVRDLLTYSPMAIMIVADRTEKCYFANAPMAALRRSTEINMGGVTPTDVFLDHEHFRLALAEARAGNRLRDVETRLLRVDGGVVWVLMSTSPIEFDNNPCVAFFFYDISDRKRSDEALKLFGAVGQELSASLDVAKVNQILAQRLPEIIGAIEVAIHLLESQEGDIRRVGSDGHAMPDFSRDRDHPVNFVISNGREFIEQRAEGEAIHLPLTANERLLGVLSIVIGTARSDGRLERALLGSLATSVSLALVNAEKTRALTAANASLDHIAHHDMLTGAPNRLQFYQVAAQKISNARRTRQPLSLLLLDIDHFKAINDSYGHPAGDEVLRAVAKAIGAGIRQGDLMARFGGEEFALLLPAMGLAQACVLAEQLREVIADLAIAVDRAQIAVTVSIGVAECASGDADIDAVVKRADNALYRAKKAGRNLVASASDDSLLQPVEV